MSTGSQMETNAGPKRCELAHTWKNTREAGLQTLEAGDLKAGRTGKKTGEASGESGSTKRRARWIRYTILLN